MAEIITFEGVSGANEGKTFTAEVGSQEFKQFVDMGFKQVSGGESLATNQTGQISASETDFATPTNISVADGVDQTISGPSGVQSQVDTQGMQATIDSQISTIDQQVAQNQAQQAAQQAEVDRRELELRGTEGFAEDKARELFDEAGIRAKQDALIETKNQMAALEQKLQISLAQLEDQTIPMEFIVGQQALLQRQTAAKANYLASKAAILSDELNFAKDELNFYFDAAMQDHQNTVSNLRLLLDYDRQDLINLDEEEKRLAERKADLELARAEKIEQDRDKILQLMADNPEAWAGAELSLDMPYEEMLQKMVDWKVSQPVAGEYQSVVVNGHLFTFDKNTGQYSDTGMVVPKQSVRNVGEGDNIFGKNVKKRTKLYIGQEYVGDEILFSDNSKAFVDPTGTRELSTQPTQITGGFTSITGEEVQPEFLPPELDLSKVKPGTPSTASTVGDWDDIDPNTGLTVYDSMVKLFGDSAFIDTLRTSGLKPADIL